MTLADRFILRPSVQPIDSPGASCFNLDMSGDFGRCALEVWTARTTATRGGEPRAFVLEFCGNTVRAERAVHRAAHQWAHLPVEIWSPNYPGYGRSGGPATLNAIPRAALAAFDEIERRAAGRPVFVGGVSLGTAPALYVAGQRHIAGLVLRNPPPLRSLILRKHGWWNLWLLAGLTARRIPPALDSLTNARRVTAPCVFLSAERDEVVPFAYQQLVVDGYAGPKRHIRMPGAKHRTAIDDAALEHLADELKWLWASALRDDATAVECPAANTLRPAALL